MSVEPPPSVNKTFDWIWIKWFDSLYQCVSTLSTDVASAGTDIEVEDDGTSITTAATKLNFVGFTITEPTSDEVTISVGVPTASNEFCPGYTSYTRVDDNEFTVDLVNAEHLFYAGRRVKFDKAGVFDYGTISSVDFNVTSANDTHVTLTMEGADTVPTGTFDVCLVSSSAAWSPIAGDPFSGGVINDITTGIIGSTQWYFAVGNGGKIATSSDGGVTWTLRTTTTTEHFNACTYDSTNETFWAGGQAGVLASSTNGTSITEDTSSIPGLTGSGSDDITGISYSTSEDAILLVYQTGASTYASASSLAGGAWTQRGSSIGNTDVAKSLKHNHTGSAVTGPVSYNMRLASVTHYELSTHDDTTTSTAGNGSAALSALGMFYDSTANRVLGSVNGDITGHLGWTGDDTATFGNQINAFAYSSTHSRLVCVGDSQQIGYWDSADKATTDAWTSVSNGFDPTANITSVTWNGTDAVFVAVANNGQICRSSNGTN